MDQTGFHITDTQYLDLDLFLPSKKLFRLFRLPDLKSRLVIELEICGVDNWAPTSLKNMPGKTKFKDNYQ